MTEIIDYTWNTSTTKWYKGTKQAYGYDDFNNIIQIERYSWNSDDSEWMILIKINYHLIMPLISMM